MTGKTYTTFDLAKILDVYPTTIANWVDKGKIRAFTTPGRHRRINEEDLLRFLKKYKMPIPEGLKEGGKKRVLIVDDEKKFINIIRRGLGKFPEKYVLSFAMDGFQAGQAINDFSPDLIILDLMLPGIDGFEVCARIRKNEKLSHIKILAITGYDSSNFRKKILNTGANDYLPKPFDISLLIEKIEKILK
ncbi:response regulator [Elusimicrobiota bacterium]